MNRRGQLFGLTGWQVNMVFSRKLDKIPFLYAESAEHTDDTVSAVNRRKKLLPIRETCTDGSSFTHRVEVSVYKRLPIWSLRMPSTG
jgi:hypothetical protein